MNVQISEGAGTNETVKRQRRWNSDNVKVSEGKAPNLSVSNALDEASIPTIKRTFTRSDSAISEDSPKERIGEPLQDSCSRFPFLFYNNV